MDRHAQVADDLSLDGCANQAAVVNWVGRQEGESIMSNAFSRQILEDLELLGFAKQSTLSPPATNATANSEDGADALERRVRAKVGKPGDPEPSDARLKRDIHHVATREDGLRVYAFKYLWDDAVRVGVMAQDLLRNEAWRPCVSDANGYYAVDYGRLGLRMTTLDEWEAKGLNALKA